MPKKNIRQFARQQLRWEIQTGAPFLSEPVYPGGELRSHNYVDQVRVCSFLWLFCSYGSKLKGGRERRRHFADGCWAIASSDGSLGRVMKGRKPERERG